MKAIFLTLCSIIAIGFAQNVTIFPQYDDATLKMRVFTVHRALVLFCDVTPSLPTLELSWTRDGVNVHEIAGLQNRFEILTAENKFVIDRTVEEDQGLYSCELPNLNKSGIFNVIANVATRTTKETQLIEGESLWLVCRIVGTDPKVTWVLPSGIQLDNSTDRIILEPENGIANSALYIASVLMEDRGNYTCTATNQATTLPNYAPSTAYGMVRIRTKLAPLWPVVGIFVQAFVLFVVLYIYEKFFHEDDDLDGDEDEYLPRKTTEKYNRKDT